MGPVGFSGGPCFYKDDFVDNVAGVCRRFCNRPGNPAGNKASFPGWTNTDGKMEGSNIDELNTRLQVLENRVYGEHGRNNKPVKVIGLWEWWKANI